MAAAFDAAVDATVDTVPDNAVNVVDRLDMFAFVADSELMVA